MSDYCRMTPKIDELISRLVKYSKISVTIDAYALSRAEAEVLVVELEKHRELLGWCVHYISDRQYEKIPIDKDFNLREALAKAKALGERK